MTEIFGVPTQALFGQLLIGLINGAFYAMLSLGLAVIFGLLNIINFSHGAQYMLGRVLRLFPARVRGCRLLVVAAPGAARRGHHRNHHRAHHAVPAVQARSPLRIAPDVRHRAHDPGGYSRTTMAAPAGHIACRTSSPAHSISASCACRSIAPGSSPHRQSSCFGTWYVIERTKLGSYLRAATENPVARAGLRHQCSQDDHPDLRLRRRTRRIRGRDGSADLPGEPADGRQPHHRRISQSWSSVAWARSSARS